MILVLGPYRIPELFVVKQTPSLSAQAHNIHFIYV